MLQNQISLPMWLSACACAVTVVSAEFSKCVTIDHPKFSGSSEDVVIYKDGLALVAAGDMTEGFLFGLWDEKGGIKDLILPGGILTVDLKNWGGPGTQPTIKEVPIIGMPSDTVWLSHGIYLSNATSKLYSVNHGFSDGGEAVLVFDVADGEDGPTLSYDRAIKSDLWSHGQLNDVIEGPSGKELYVTRTLHQPLSVTGPQTPENSVMQIFGSTPPGGGVIFHCAWEGKDDEPVCKKALAEGGGMSAPNGITINPVRPNALDFSGGELGGVEGWESGVLLPHHLFETISLGGR
jgi:hypothetical protein